MPSIRGSQLEKGMYTECLSLSPSQHSQRDQSITPVAEATEVIVKGDQEKPEGSYWTLPFWKTGKPVVSVVGGQMAEWLGNQAIH